MCPSVGYKRMSNPERTQYHSLFIIIFWSIGMAVMCCWCWISSFFRSTQQSSRLQRLCVWCNWNPFHLFFRNLRNDFQFTKKLSSGRCHLIVLNYVVPFEQYESKSVFSFVYFCNEKTQFFSLVPLRFLSNYYNSRVDADDRLWSSFKRIACCLLLFWQMKEKLNWPL